MSATGVPEERSNTLAESGWSYPVKFFQLRNFGFWIYVWLVANGIWLFYEEIREYTIYPSALLLRTIRLSAKARLPARLVAERATPAVRTDRLKRWSYPALVDNSSLVNQDNSFHAATVRSMVCSQAAGER